MSNGGKCYGAKGTGRGMQGVWNERCDDLQSGCGSLQDKESFEQRPEGSKEERHMVIQGEDAAGAKALRLKNAGHDGEKTWRPMWLEE